MHLVHELMTHERRFWEASSAGDSEKVRDCMTDDALAVGFFGVLNKDATAKAAEGQRPFEFWRIDEEPKLLQLTTSCAAVIYQATAKREGGEPFTATMTSIYVWLDGEWKLALYHQTQMEGAPNEPTQGALSRARLKQKHGQAAIPAQ